jgi:hypothetical protein
MTVEVLLLQMPLQYTAGMLRSFFSQQIQTPSKEALCTVQVP